MFIDKIVLRNGKPIYTRVNNVRKVWIAKTMIPPPEGTFYLLDNDNNPLMDLDKFLIA
jgi:hypothetical protein